MGWDWAVAGISDDIPRTTGPECINYMTDRRRWMETILLSTLFIFIMHRSWQRLQPIKLPPLPEIQKPHSPTRLFFLIALSMIFGIEMGFKLSGQSMIFALNPCHVQSCLQIFLLAAKPTKTTTALFRIQMSNLNGPFLAFLFPEVEGRTYPFEQATYWIQHALLYIIPIYIIRSGAYTVEDLSEFHWSHIGTAFMLFYHFVLLSPLSINTKKWMGTPRDWAAYRIKGQNNTFYEVKFAQKKANTGSSKPYIRRAIPIENYLCC
nr:transmembrane protein 164 isoform X2 [Drosophila suzukii]